MNRQILILVLVAFMTACGRQGGKSGSVPEDQEAKALLQGIWIEEESEDLSFRVKGDTIFYADSTSMPAYFRIVGDSLELASGTKYGIVKQTPNVFWFVNQNGDVMKLRKSENQTDVSEFVHDTPEAMVYTHQVKTDSVVVFNGERYHWYIAVNPTKYKVTRHVFNDDGMEVENVYYDNIMHVSVFQGTRKLFSQDFRKQMYSKMVPASFLKEAILGKMEYGHADAKGLHFYATLCIPDGASCYMIETLVNYMGQMTMRTVEY